MPSYQYTPFRDETSEFRLMVLHPGKFDDEMRISIVHSPFTTGEPPVSKKLQAEQLRWALLPNWTVVQTLEGRYMFIDKSTKRSSWSHPDPDVNLELYEPNTEDESIDSDYEALSYVWGNIRDSETAHVEEKDHLDSNIRNISTLR